MSGDCCQLSRSHSPTRTRTGMSLWQCRACGQLYHGQSPEQGGSPCVCARAALPSPSPPPTLTPASAPAPTAEPASTLSVADFDIGPLIGSGGYSKVFLCWLKGNEVTYALKVIDKKHVFAEEEQDHVLYELRVLAAHVPLANQLFFAFQDVYALYMVMVRSSRALYSSYCRTIFLVETCSTL